MFDHRLLQIPGKNLLRLRHFLILLAFEVFHSSHIILSVRRNRNSKGLRVLRYINKRTSFSQSMVFLNAYLIVVAVLFASGLFVNLMDHFNNSTMAILK